MFTSSLSMATETSKRTPIKAKQVWSILYSEQRREIIRGILSHVARTAILSLSSMHLIWKKILFSCIHTHCTVQYMKGKIYQK
jgi:hypothetical protein